MDIEHWLTVELLRPEREQERIGVILLFFTVYTSLLIGLRLLIEKLIVIPLEERAKRRRARRSPEPQSLRTPDPAG